MGLGESGEYLGDTVDQVYDVLDMVGKVEVKRQNDAQIGGTVDQDTESNFPFVIFNVPMVPPNRYSSREQHIQVRGPKSSS